jgi:hypothetical protein
MNLLRRLIMFKRLIEWLRWRPRSAADAAAERTRRDKANEDALRASFERVSAKAEESARLALGASRQQQTKRQAGKR